MAIAVDDPHCRYDTLSNGTIIMSYDGYIGSWETVAMACSGVNLLAPNVVLIGVTLCITALCIVMAYRNGSKRTWTRYNKVMLLGPCLLMTGVAIEMYSVSTWYQWDGHPDWCHVPKPFWYLGTLCMGYVQGFRIEFILIATNRPRHWDKRILAVLLGICVILGLVSLAIFFVGTTHGVDHTPFNFILLYTGAYMIIGVTDVLLSMAILTICANNDAVIRTLDTLSFCDSEMTKSNPTEKVRKFARENRIPALVQLAGDFIFATCYLIGILGPGGYTFGVVAIMGPTCANLFLLYSVESMKKAAEAGGRSRIVDYVLATNEDTGTRQSDVRRQLLSDAGSTTIR
ncbi:hypothetical protein HKX48_006062 [Thoreauomyces humboldtii]|nr:hypothetical protein HKX48_006062 [Thoreauomyces humboldtii]